MSWRHPDGIQQLQCLHLAPRRVQGTPALGIKQLRGSCILTLHFYLEVLVHGCG